MRLLIDATGAPMQSGGMRSYAEQLVWTWAEEFPADELFVAGGAWLREAFGSTQGVHLVLLKDGAGQRFISQWWRVARAARRLRVDVVHSLSPIVTPLSGPARFTSNTVHDWRHIRRPEEFGWAQRAYRRAWLWSTRHAGLSVQISTKTAAETAELAPGAANLLAPSGTDHARRWSPRETDHRGRLVVTFGHHSNKRPGLVLEAIAEVIREQPSTELVILGARGEFAESLQRRAALLGIAEHVRTPGFVDANTYQALLAGASTVVLASSDEGFGLPVAEAAYFGIPVVSTHDNGLGKLHSYPIVQAAPDPGSVARAIATALVDPRPTAGLTGPSWSETVQTIRSGIATSLARVPSERPSGGTRC